MSPIGRREGGFTLLELMIALVLVTLIVTLLFGGLRLANRVWGAVDTRAEQQSEMRLIWRFLEGRLGQTRAVFTKTEEGDKMTFYGERDAVELVSPMPAHLGVSGLYLMRLHLAGSELKLTRWLFHPDILEGDGGIPEWRPLAESGSDPGAGPREMRAYFSQSVLVEGVKRFELDYYGVKEMETTPDWSDEWEQNRVPSLVRIRIRDGRRAWPEMILRVGQ